MTVIAFDGKSVAADKTLIVQRWKDNRTAAADQKSANAALDAAALQDPALAA